jgi:hypothetical protein
MHAPAEERPAGDEENAADALLSVNAIEVSRAHHR